MGSSIFVPPTLIPSTPVAFPLGVPDAVQIPLDTLCEGAEESARLIATSDGQGLADLVNGRLGVPRHHFLLATRQLMEGYFLGRAPDAVCGATEPSGKSAAATPAAAPAAAAAAEVPYDIRHNSCCARDIVALTDDRFIVIAGPAAVGHREKGCIGAVVNQRNLIALIGRPGAMEEQPLWRAAVMPDGGSQRITVPEGEIFIPVPYVRGLPPPSLTAKDGTMTKGVRVLMSQEQVEALGIDLGALDPTRRTRGTAAPSWSSGAALGYDEIEKLIDAIPTASRPGISFLLSPYLGFAVMSQDEVRFLRNVVGIAAYGSELYVARDVPNEQRVGVVRVPAAGAGVEVATETLPEELRRELRLV